MTKPDPQTLDGDEPSSPQNWGAGGASSPPRWRIEPEPTDDELVALVTTLSVALAPPAAGAEPSALPSRWATAGRLAALTPWPPAAGRGWSGPRR